jgi:hypothetical protein
MTLIRSLFLAALLFAVVSRADAGTAHVDLDALEEVSSQHRVILCFSECQQALLFNELNATEPSGGSCGGNCPGGNCDSCPCGTTPKPQDINAMYDALYLMKLSAFELLNTGAPSFQDGPRNAALASCMPRAAATVVCPLL